MNRECIRAAWIIVVFGALLYVQGISAAERKAVFEKADYCWNAIAEKKGMLNVLCREAEAPYGKSLENMLLRQRFDSILESYPVLSLAEHEIIASAEGDSFACKIWLIADLFNNHKEKIEELNRYVRVSGNVGGKPPMPQAKYISSDYRLAWEYLLMAPLGENYSHLASTRILVALGAMGDPKSLSTVERYWKAVLKIEKIRGINLDLVLWWSHIRKGAEKT